MYPDVGKVRERGEYQGAPMRSGMGVEVSTERQGE